MKKKNMEFISTLYYSMASLMYVIFTVVFVWVSFGEATDNFTNKLVKNEADWREMCMYEEKVTNTEFAASLLYVIFTVVFVWLVLEEYANELVKNEDDEEEIWWDEDNAFPSEEDDAEDTDAPPSEEAEGEVRGESPSEEAEGEVRGAPPSENPMSKIAMPAYPVHNFDMPYYYYEPSAKTDEDDDRFTWGESESLSKDCKFVMDEPDQDQDEEPEHEGRGCCSHCYGELYWNPVY